jgi:outer membrane protein assembly factor BamA
LHLFRITIVLLALLAACLHAEVEVTFEDGTPDWRKIVQDYAKKQDSASLADSVATYLTDQGFLDNAVRESRKNDESILSIYFGSKYNIGDIIIESDNFDTLVVNRVLSEINVNDALDSIVADFQARGYYYASLVPLKWTKRDSAVNFYMRFEKGPEVTISSIELEGLKKIRPNYLKNYLSIAPGDTLYPDKLRNSTQDFERLDFVRLKDPPRVIPEAGLEKVVVEYRFNELQQYFIEGAGGYIPEDEGYFVWMVNLLGRNMMGAGQRAGLFVDKREKYKSVFRVFYGQPVFLFGPDYAELKIHTRDYRDQFYEFGLGLSYDLYVGRSLALNSSLGWKNVEPSDSLSRSFEVYEAGFAIKAGSIQTRRVAPTQFAMDWRLKYSGRHYKPLYGDTLLTRSVYNDARSDLTGELSLPILSFLSDYHLANVKTVESPEKPLPLSELYLFGGAGSLRGYRNDQFAARRLFLFESELRSFISGTDYIYPFYDIAYYEWYQNNDKNKAVKRDDVKFGYGVGVSLSSTSRQLIIELSWGESTIAKEPRLNIRLSNQF